MNTIKLREVLSKNIDHIDIENSKVYTQVTVRLWGKGVCKRDEISGSDIKSGKRFVVKENQFIISKIDARHGAYGLIPKELNAAVITSDFPSYNLDTTRILPQYFQWIFSQKKFIELCKNASSGTTNRIRLNESKFLDLEIALPPIDKQEEIIKRLNKDSNTLRMIQECNTKNQEFVQNLRQVILQEAVSGKLVPQYPTDEPASELLKEIKTEKEKLITEKKIKKEQPLPPISEQEIPFTLPKGWEWIRLGTIAGLITKGSSPRWQGVNYVKKNEGILFITSENVGSFKMDLTNEKYVEKKFNVIEPRSILKNGDFLMNIVGASIGRTAIFNLGRENVNINQAVCLIRLCGNFLNKDYLLYFFNSNFCISSMFDKQVEIQIISLQKEKIGNGLFLRDFLLKGQEALENQEGAVCPLCLREIDKEQLLNQINSRLQTLQELSSQAASVRQISSRAESKLNELIGFLGETCEETKQFEQLQDDETNLLNTMQRLEYLKGIVVAVAGLNVKDEINLKESEKSITRADTLIKSLSKKCNELLQAAGIPNEWKKKMNAISLTNRVAGHVSEISSIEKTFIRTIKS